MRLFLPPLLLAIATSMGGCWSSANEFMREPFFTPVGSGSSLTRPRAFKALEFFPRPAIRTWAAAVSLQPTAHRECGRHRAGADFDERQGDPWQRIRSLPDNQGWSCRRLWLRR